ncbi:MAG TPA: SPOR domain-containing protein [Noviherbaspirillum sp.]|uniref:SPOR domain-containing protein n=1 Tax=Noviherbaspirillum sp. TaxID=1926288 RepID=UPI002B46E903|nr:SPOR domain-containing protein [Noviherbaspirillum sp.]HJV87200.1 SPOR domain-containing protein [Noviherbaspirillum sp.]
MLKFFFWILLLANAGLFAYQQGYFDALMPSGREPARVSQQLNVDKIRLVPAAEAKRLATPPAPAAAPEPDTTPVSAVEKKVEPLACAEIGNFNPEEAKRFSAQLAELSLGERLTRQPVQEVASHMVYIPPQADKDAAEKKADELRRLGIDDFFIIQDNSSMRWAISLGVFKQEEAARAHLASLNQKGVRSARIGERTVTTNLVSFRVRDMNAATKTAVEKISASFSRQEMRNCKPA